MQGESTYVLVVGQMVEVLWVVLLHLAGLRMVEVRGAVLRMALRRGLL